MNVFLVKFIRHCFPHAAMTFVEAKQMLDGIRAKLTDEELSFFNAICKQAQISLAQARRLRDCPEELRSQEKIVYVPDEERGA